MHRHTATFLKQLLKMVSRNTGDSGRKALMEDW